MESKGLKFKIVYVLVSHLKDTYAEQCYLSIYSLRKVHPVSSVTIVMDNDTHQELSGVRKELLEMADDVVVVDFEDDVTPMVRSRVLKTTLRQRIEGDFMFLDCDTVCVKPLYELNSILSSCGGGIYAVQDCHVPVHGMSPGNIAYHTANANKIGYDIEKEDEHFFNSGMQLVTDSKESHQFYEKWNDNYLRWLQQACVRTDQATMSLTNGQMGHVIKRLPVKFNFQISATIYKLKSACIIHYFATGCPENGGIFPLQNQSLLRELRDDPEKVKRITDKCMENPINSLDYFKLMCGYVEYNQRLRKMAHVICKCLIGLKVKLLKK